MRVASITLALVASTIIAGCVSHRTPETEPPPRDKERWNTYTLDQQERLDAMAMWPVFTPDQVLAGAVPDDGSQPVMVEGTVVKVCLTMGCWMEVGSSSEPLLVMTRDHEFFVPRNSVGTRARVYGRVVTREQSVELLQHLARDAGASQAEIDAITAPRTRRVIIADAIAMPPEWLDRPVVR